MTVRVETWKCVSYRSDFSNVVLVLSVQIISSSTAFFLDAKITPKSWKRTFENYNLWIPELWKVQILWFSFIYWNKAIYIPFQQSKKFIKKFHCCRIFKNWQKWLIDMDWLSAEQKGWIFDRNFYISSFAKNTF